MKVLHLISGGDSGGAKTHLFSLLDKLKHIATVRVGCLMDGVFYRELQHEDVDNVLFKQKNRFDLSVVDSIVKMINDEGFDVFHVHGARANFVACFVMKKINIPTITTIHSDYLLDFDQIVKKLVFTNMNKAALKRIPYYIAVSDNFKDMLIERGFRPNSIYTVYNGMDLSTVPQSVTPKEEFCVKRGFCYDKDTVYVGIAARFDRVKGVDVFIKAAGEVLKKYDNVEFLIAGDGVDKEKLTALANEVDKSGRIRFLGFEKDIYGFLNVIDVNCLTSLCESFPYSMLEGAVMGVPMVASRVGGIPSLVVDGETGFLFESGDYISMAEKLGEMIDNPSIIREMGRNIEARVREYFTNDTFAKRHTEIYESIVRDFHEKKKYDFVISGYYGFHNNGDDALLLAISEELRRKKPDVRMLVLSNTPKETRKIYRVDAASRVNLIAAAGVMKKAKVLLSGGGSLLQDETSSKSLWYYLSVIKLAKKCGCRVMQFANGFGPVKREFNKKLAARIINDCVDVVTLRDFDSKYEMEKIGVNKECLVTADPALLLCGVGEKQLARLMREEGIPEGDYMTVSVRSWKRSREDFEIVLGSALKEFARIHNLNIIFVPMQYPNDVEISEKIALFAGDRAYVPKRQIAIREAIELIGKSKINLAMRLHAMIYSVSRQVKTAALRYDPKIDAFMDYAGLEEIADVESLEKDTVLNALERAFEKDILPCDELKTKARINTDEAMKLLD